MLRHEDDLIRLANQQDTGEGTVYLLCFTRSFGHAHHYVGWAKDLRQRLAHHRAGTGANLLKHARAAGIDFVLVRTWPGSKRRERQIKNWGHAADQCPFCRQESARAERRRRIGRESQRRRRAGREAQYVAA